jgi:hypothetical protein
MCNGTNNMVHYCTYNTRGIWPDIITIVYTTDTLVDTYVPSRRLEVTGYYIWK